MGVSASLPKLKFYQAPTTQSSWSKRPFHVALSTSLWTDLLMVAVLFRLNEYTLAHLVDGFSGFWLPTTVFFAVYDVWETRVLFDSVFRFQDDFVHSFLGICQWLLLAVMATTITPTPVWHPFDALLFSGLKLAHQTIRVFNYLETWRFSTSKRARKAAGVRSIAYVIGWPFYLASLCMFAIGTFSTDYAGGMWVIGFFVQRLIWFFLKWDPIQSTRFPFAQNARAIKTNVPFKTTRYGDWTMLQLGAIILGFMTVPTSSLESYGVLVFGYTYVAALNLLSYSMNPEDPNQHALIKEGIREFAWLELFSLGGLAFMGIAAGLRIHLFYPTLVVLPKNRHYTWILCISATVSTVVMFGQEYSHGGQIVRLNGGKVIWMKIFTASLYILVGGVFIGTDTRIVAFLILGLALVSLAVLLLQVLNGAFRRQIIKTYRLKLMGHFRAAIIAMIWLSRARRNLREFESLTKAHTDGLANLNDSGSDDVGTTPPNNSKEDNNLNNNSSFGTISINHVDSGNVSDDSQTMSASVTNVNKRFSLDNMMVGSINIDKKLSAASQPSGTHGIDHKLSVLSAPALAAYQQQPPHHHLSLPHDPASRNRKGSLLQEVIHHTVSMNGVVDYLAGRRLSVDRARRLSTFVKNDIRVWKIVINERIYTQPRVFVEGNKATKYRVQWSDLFFDVLFVGVVFRLGDLLLAGIGATFSEVSVHYEDVLGGGNGTIYVVPKDPARPDAIFIFGSVFVAVWAMWQNKLAYSSKVGTNDVAHKLVDMAQGLAVLLCAVNITTPNQMANAQSGNAYAVAGSLLAFQLSMVGLWVELLLTEGKRNTRAHGTAMRNIQRDSFTILPLMCSFATIATGVTLSVTTFLWALSWLLPFIMRVAVLRFVNDQNAVRDLHRYVIHRLGDGALIVLGEGVLQIIRAETSPQVFAYLTVTLGLFLVTAVRIAVWSMDCFTDPSKHAQLLSLDAGLAAYFIRSVSAPSLVCMGVAMKKMIAVTSDSFSPKNVNFYWLLCGASTISLFTLVITYELHRFSFHRKWRKREFFYMVLLSSFFCYWAPIPAPAWVIVALCLFTWLLAVVVHFFLDDYFLLKEQVKDRNKAESSLKRTGSNATHKSRKSKSHYYNFSGGNAFDHMQEQLETCCDSVRYVMMCGCIRRRLFASGRDGTAVLDDENDLESKLPPAKRLLPLESKDPVRINDQMGPHVGNLERQPSVIMTDTGHRELSSTNPSFSDSHVNNNNHNKDHVVVVDVEASPDSNAMTLSNRESKGNKSSLRSLFQRKASGSAVVSKEPSEEEEHVVASIAVDVPETSSAIRTSSLKLEPAVMEEQQPPPPLQESSALMTSAEIAPSQGPPEAELQ